MHRLFSLVVGLGLSSCGGASPAPGDPALRLHGHNDYLQAIPLHAALALGLGSVEADVFLEDGELRVGHERGQLRAGRTLRSLYLEPLHRHAREQGGYIRSDGRPFVLLVDIKANGTEVYPRLRSELAEFRDLLTNFRGGRTESKAVTVVISGDRPHELVAADADRLCALDGRLEDLDENPPADLVPWISDSWSRVGTWDGQDDLLPEENEHVAMLVTKAHAQGRELRFWGAPDCAEAWTTLWQLGVDRIDTDRPRAAVECLRRFADGR